ncbi:hypothetical protein [Nocardia pseudovaccinii]|uniref:hypothetical protein n=1 Tax=Nocardia pseudovaccinii TaxID=189540 RepID=UPI000AF46911|nr:hypothetical protein [Nocardia pseudovaccinii]
MFQLARFLREQPVHADNPAAAAAAKAKAHKDAHYWLERAATLRHPQALELLHEL